MVLKNGDEFFSSAACSIYSVNYEFGKIARGLEGTPLFAFEEITQAYAFERTLLTSDDDLRILECEYDKPFIRQGKMLPAVLLFSRLNQAIIQEYWKTGLSAGTCHDQMRNFEYDYDEHTVPNGTILVQELTPIRLAEL